MDYDKDSYHDQWTGRGYYKSSAQNAMRVARTETNIAYRRADRERWSKLDFVLGFRIQLSRQHPQEDICDDLVGDYPKTFKFDGWHPQCFCFATPILASEDKIAKMNEAFARGEDYTPQGRQITDYPDAFKGWVRDNADKIAEARARGTEPYFLRNNRADVDKILNPEAEAAELTLEDIAALADEKRYFSVGDIIKEPDVQAGVVAWDNVHINGEATFMNLRRSDIEGGFNESSPKMGKSKAKNLEAGLTYADKLEQFHRDAASKYAELYANAKTDALRNSYALQVRKHLEQASDCQELRDFYQSAYGMPKPASPEVASSESESEKKEITIDSVKERFGELKARIKEGKYKSPEIVEYRAQAVTAFLQGDVPPYEIDKLLDKLADAVDNEAEPEVQKFINSLPPFKPAHVTVKLRDSYANSDDVAETLNQINDMLGAGQKWSEHGRISIVEFTEKGANGSTQMDGVIKLSKDRHDSVVSAFAKLSRKEPITEDEANAMITLWHEINHNRNLWGHVREDASTSQTHKMELANEFVSRHTLNELYSAFGIRDIPHPQLMWHRPGAGYEDMVVCYETVISSLGLNHGGVVRSVQTGLYRQPYKEQGDVLVSAIWESWSRKKNVPPLKRKDIESLISKAAREKRNEIIEQLKALGYSVK